MSDGISRALNTSFVEEAKKEIVSIDKELEKLDTKKKSYDSKRVSIEDKEYLALELKELIASSQEVRRILEENLRKPPHKASDVEAYSMVIGQITTLVRELRQLNVDVVSTELTQRKMDLKTETTNAPSIGTQNNNVFLLDAKSINAMIANAKSTAQLQHIDATFDTSDNK